MNVSKKAPESFKIILVGDAGVGKTSIVMRFQHDIFLPDYQNTIGGSYITKIIEGENGPIGLNIWDTAGQEKYRSLVPMYTRGAAAALIIFDISDNDGFEIAKTWIAQVKQEALDDCQIFVVGNKIDKGREILEKQKEDIENFCKKSNFHFEVVSALTGEGINGLFQKVAKSIPNGRYQPTIESIAVNGQNEKSSCC
ncbi:GTP-binding protein ypt5 [Tritrichomonas foetus]|uniref:GTP-binding protein ypt5 n=1 Tax=Tritrichomonas foetus TaxID=1144522 RepID=A0A1J4L2R9_9EUKA|nr:GTP-binding protein ypt5 [Tritrichomonas foetus]|eukprot:OHT16246.1 GTP-binding protein ypt5 [Tritrichomonas foetus]